MDAVARLTNTPSLITIPKHTIEGSRGSSLYSVLSSPPSGLLLTPTFGSNPGEDGYGAGSDRRIYERRQRITKRWVYFPENRNEYRTLEGQTPWRCAYCKFISLYLFHFL